jgi:1-acyl-sn-glycerol-3-phosphate acyltransferase
MKYAHFRQSDGWFYLLAEPIFHFAYRCLFRKIYLHNPKGVPANKPVLIAANHPTAFTDPMVLCLFLAPPIYNMTRGDIFRKPALRMLMESVNMFPVFRVRDGYTERGRNDEVFEFCKGKMRKRQTVAIYVEGEHHLDKRVRPVKKGLARIAFGTYAESPMDDLQIIPAGTNYNHGDRSRDEVKMIIGQPIFVKDYWDDYQANPAAAINRLSSDIETALKSICYHVDDPADDTLAEQRLECWRSDNPASLLPVVEESDARFRAEKALLDQLNVLPAEEKALLRARSGRYFEALQAAGLRDAALLHPAHAGAAWAGFLLLGALPAALGAAVSWPSRKIARGVTDKAVKKKEFYTSVLVGLGFFAGTTQVLLMLLAGLFWLRPWLLALALLSPALTWFFYFYRDLLQRYQAAQKAQQHPEKAHLLQLRREIGIS